MKTNIHLWSYLALFFLEWEMFQAKVAEKIKPHFMFNNFFRKSCRLWDNVKKYCRARQPHMTIWRMRIVCWITKATYAQLEYVILTDFHGKNA